MVFFAVVHDVVLLDVTFEIACVASEVVFSPDVVVGPGVVVVGVKAVLVGVSSLSHKQYFP